MINITNLGTSIIKLSADAMREIDRFDSLTEEEKQLERKKLEEFTKRFKDYMQKGIDNGDI